MCVVGAAVIKIHDWATFYPLLDALAAWRRWTK
jgi:hypothetical protein